MHQVLTMNRRGAALQGKQGKELFWESFSLCHSSNNENDSQLEKMALCANHLVDDGGQLVHWDFAT
jgi:hypothetical protein